MTINVDYIQYCILDYRPGAEIPRPKQARYLFIIHKDFSLFSYVKDVEREREEGVGVGSATTTLHTIVKMLLNTAAGLTSASLSRPGSTL